MFTVKSPGSVTSLGSSRCTDVGRWETLTDKSSVQHAARMNCLKDRMITKISSCSFKHKQTKNSCAPANEMYIHKSLKSLQILKKLHKNTSINYSQLIVEILIFKSFGKHQACESFNKWMNYFVFAQFNTALGEPTNRPNENNGTTKCNK